MNGLLRRGVRLLYLYTAEAWFFNHRGQFAPMMGWRRLPAEVNVEYWRDADHIFRSMAAHGRLVQFLADWVERRFAGADAAGGERRWTD